MKHQKKFVKLRKHKMGAGGVIGILLALAAIGGGIAVYIGSKKKKATVLPTAAATVSPVVTAYPDPGGGATGAATGLPAAAGETWVGEQCIFTPSVRTDANKPEEWQRWCATGLGIDRKAGNQTATECKSFGGPAPHWCNAVGTKPDPTKDGDEKCTFTPCVKTTENAALCGGDDTVVDDAWCKANVIRDRTDGNQTAAECKSFGGDGKNWCVATPTALNQTQGTPACKLDSDCGSGNCVDSKCAKECGAGLKADGDACVPV